MVRLVLALMAVVFVGLPGPATATQTCAGLTEPVHGSIVRRFAPVGEFSGHWGIDWGVPTGTDVVAAGAGTVTYAGRVAGNLTVTVAHGGGLRTSYSYLTDLTVQRGERVRRGSVVGRSGVDHGREAVHFSVRLGTTYLDPGRLLGCRGLEPSRALRLVEGGETP